jgi:hypothetical protein
MVILTAVLSVELNGSSLRAMVVTTRATATLKRVLSELTMDKHVNGFPPRMDSSHIAQFPITLLFPT